MCLIRTAREWSNPAVTEDTLLLLAGALAVPYVITSVGIVPYVAGQKGRSGLVWILISLLVSPVIALLALAAMPVTRGDDDQMAPCPYCAEDVKTDAVVCPHCRSSLDPRVLGRLPHGNGDADARRARAQRVRSSRRIVIVLGSSPRPSILTSIVRAGKSGRSLSAHSTTVTPSPCRSSGTPSSNSSTRLWVR